MLEKGSCVRSESPRYSLELVGDMISSVWLANDDKEQKVARRISKPRVRRTRCEKPSFLLYSSSACLERCEAFVSSLAKLTPSHFAQRGCSEGRQLVRYDEGQLDPRRLPCLTVSLSSFICIVHTSPSC